MYTISNYIIYNNNCEAKMKKIAILFLTTYNLHSGTTLQKISNPSFLRALREFSQSAKGKAAQNINDLRNGYETQVMPHVRDLRKSVNDSFQTMKNKAAENVRNDLLLQEEVNALRNTYEAQITPGNNPWYEKIRNGIKNYFEYQNKKSDVLHEYIHGKKPDFFPKEGPLFNKQEKIKDLKELATDKSVLAQLLATVGLGCYINANKDHHESEKP